MLAGTLRSTIWDAIAGDTGQGMFCFQESVAISIGSCLALSRNRGTWIVRAEARARVLQGCGRHRWELALRVDNDNV